MSLLNYSVTLVANTNENVNDVRTMFDEARAQINNITNENIAPGAAIDYSKVNVPDGTIPLTDLATMASGELIVGNAGVPTKRALTGAGAMSAGGALSLVKASSQQGFDTNVAGNGSTFTDINGLAISCGAGTWLVWGIVNCSKGTTTGMIDITARIVDGGVTTTYASARERSTQLDIDQVTMPLMGVAVLGGTTTLKTQVVAIHAGGTAVCKADLTMWLMALRVA